MRVSRTCCISVCVSYKQPERDGTRFFVDFEDERLAEFQTEDFNSLLEAHLELYGKKPVVFLDEVQNIPHRDKFVRRLADAKYRVYVTGSNAKMLGSDVATTLGGRYITKHIMPYSFPEFLQANEVSYDSNTLATTFGRAEVQRLFTNYFRFGGFPEGARLASKRDYINSVYQKIYLGDIASRNKIENQFSLRVLFRKLAESVKQPISFTRLTNIIASTGAKLSKPTLINYLEYSKDAFLVYPIKNIADNLTQRETNPKYYFVDNGIISILAMDVDTSLLENMVAMELLRRYGLEEQVFFYNKNVEVDFYIPDAATAIQVSYNPKKSDETWERESTALIKLSKVLDCKRLIILTYELEENIELKGLNIEVIPVWKWLLDT